MILTGITCGVTIKVSAEPETLAADLSDIQAEPGVDPYGETVPETESETELDYYAIASRAIEQELAARVLADVQETETEVETVPDTLSAEEDFDLQPSLVAVDQAPLLAAPRAAVTMDIGNAYILDLDGTEYYCWFPSGSRIKVNEDGSFYNETATNIVGVISTSLSSVQLNSYNDYLTVAPLLTTQSNYNAYRYGSRVYITDYYLSGNSLVSSVEYIADYTVVQEPGAGYGFSSFQFVVTAVMLLIAFLLLIRWSKKI